MHQKGNILIGILIGLLVGAGFFGAYYLGTRKTQIPITSSTPQPSLSPIDETANWKTYENTKYKFSIKYPQDWYSYTGTAWNNIPNDNLSHVDLSPQTPPKGQGGGVPKGARIFVEETSISAYNLAKQQAINPSSVHYETINGVQVVKTSGIPSAGNGGPVIFISKGNTIIYILSESLDEKVFDQILSTFKFTN